MLAVILFDMATVMSRANAHVPISFHRVTNLRCRPGYVASLTFSDHVSKSQNSGQEN
jgi:hypothetical protein